MGDPDSARALRPLRRLTLPGGRTLLRAGLVAALLGLAAAVLHTPTSCPPTAEPSRAPTGADRAAGRSDEGESIDPGGAGPTDESDRAGPAPTRATAGDSSTTGSGTAGNGSTGRDGTTTGGGRTSALPLPSGAVGVPVRLAEPAALAVAHPGTRVDLLAATPAGAGTEATLLAPAALVLDVLGADATDGSAALYLALRPDQAKRAVGLPEGTRFAIVVRG
ncbi:flagellar biosynthesis protein FlgA [Micromonospora sp. LAH09]|uniref:flagellar biosynthesis protein FlgA n=1 Tax=Micromonospora cabrerizensis TaxID=2911213 RepID=UPI001EE869A1|nr:flagellar biosynthesis protein FlgA [Micromonospora cabrerizensis]MCG5470520.1 flagellar biosynthesis protein FlgA [Micromonospora cabrerizensis]